MVADLSHWVNIAETDHSDPDLTKVIEDLAPRSEDRSIFVK
jgi:hypothetical protein